MSATTNAIAAVWVLSALMLCVFPLIGVGPEFRLYYSNALQTLSSMLSAGACLYAMSAFPAGSPLRRVWAAMGAGVLAWGLGATIFAAFPLLNAGAETPYPYYSDIGYLLTGPLMIAGLLLFKKATGLETPIWGQFLAVLLLVASAYLAYQANAEGILDPALAMKVTSLGYTLFDPAVLAATVLTATSFRGGEVGKAWWWVVGGILLYFIANQLYTYLVLTEQYATGSPIDVGWILGFGFIAWAALKTRKLLD